MGDTAPDGPQKAADFDAVFKIYALLVEMADRVSQRRQAANAFYLSVNTALVGAAAFLGSPNTPKVSWVLGVAGMAICVLWIMNVVSYKTLNSAKFVVIQQLETKLPTRPYSDEWALLDPKGSGRRHRPFHKTEVLVPLVFMGVHAAEVACSFPWKAVTHAF